MHTAQVILHVTLNDNCKNGCYYGNCYQKPMAKQVYNDKLAKHIWDQTKVMLKSYL